MLKNTFENGLLMLGAFMLSVGFVEKIWNVASHLLESSMKGQEVFILLPLLGIWLLWSGLHSFRFIVSFTLRMVTALAYTIKGGK